MTETNESGAPRPFETTPEASMAGDESSRSSQATTGAQAAAGSGRTQESSSKDAVGDAARELADRLKPVASIAENVAVKAIELSSKGLDRLAVYLKVRQQNRGGETSDPTKDDRTS
jgi:hypothetical protein